MLGTFIDVNNYTAVVAARRHRTMSCSKSTHGGGPKGKEKLQDYRTVVVSRVARDLSAASGTEYNPYCANTHRGGELNIGGSFATRTSLYCG